MNDDITAAMAVRDLMSAIKTLSELPAAIVRLEFLDLEVVEGQLSLLLEKIHDRDTMRGLRQRSHGHTQAVIQSVAMRQVSETARAQSDRAK